MASGRRRRSGAGGARQQRPGALSGTGHVTAHSRDSAAPRRPRRRADSRRRHDRAAGAQVGHLSAEPLVRFAVTNAFDKVFLL